MYTSLYINPYIFLHIHIPWGKGVLSLERVPTVDRLPWSCGCREQKLLKRRGYPVIVNVLRELSNLFI